LQTKGPQQLAAEPLVTVSLCKLKVVKLTLSWSGHDRRLKYLSSTNPFTAKLRGTTILGLKLRCVQGIPSLYVFIFTQQNDNMKVTLANM